MSTPEQARLTADGRTPDHQLVRSLMRGNSLRDLCSQGNWARRGVEAAEGDLRRVLQVVGKERLLPAAALGFTMSEDDRARSRHSRVAGWTLKTARRDAEQLDAVAADAHEAASRALADLDAELDTQTPDGARLSRGFSMLAALVDQHVLLERIAAAERDPESLHAALGPADRALARDQLLFQGSTDTLDGHLRTWAWSIEVLERPQPSGWNEDEMSDRLYRREPIERVVTLLSPAGTEAIRRVLTPLDERFIGLTDGHAEPKYRNFSPPGISRWWWYRTPKKWKT